MAKEVNKKDNKKEEKIAKNSSNVNSMRAELKKVTWPTRKELINSTTAVIVIVIITAIIVFFLDVVFESLSTYGINRLRKVVSDKTNSNITVTDDSSKTENDINDDVDEVIDGSIDNTVINDTDADTDTTAENVDAISETPTTEENNVE